MLPRAGGIIFDALIRRNSVAASDLFEAHIGRIIAEGNPAAFVKERYASFDSGKGADFARGALSFKDLAGLAMEYGAACLKNRSVRR
ncbi:MAG: hypothetical protein E4H20_03225 [Spirochaetales bacterium]|nr:MAG: hypothetical protein E4H20_03225 [Spirochaetales bacterium]